MKSVRVNILRGSLGFSLSMLGSMCHAQSGVQVYGLIDLSIAQLQAAGAGKVQALASGSMATSFIGFRGTEDLGDGLSALFVLEGYMRNDTGEMGRFNGDGFFTRNSYVGLSSRQLGTVTLGRNTTPLFVSTLRFNALGASVGFSPSMRHWVSGAAGAIIGDTGWNDSVRYDTPRFGPVQFSGMVNTGEGNANAVGNNYSAQALYDSGSLSAALVWQSVGNATAPLPVGFRRQDALQANVSYDFTLFKVYGQFGRVEQRALQNQNRATNIGDVGARVPIGQGAVLLAYGEATNSGTATNVRRTTSMGYDHFLSKRSDVYAVYMSDRNTRQSNGNSVALGMRHTF
jgi:predicted porin